MKKIKLLLGLLLSIFITLPTSCNAEEVPTMKWEDVISDEFTDTYYLNDKLYNINNDILVVHNSSLQNTNIRLYSNSGEKKWEYTLTQNKKIGEYLLVNNNYLGFIEIDSDENPKGISLLDINSGKITKKIDIKSKFKDLYSYSNLVYIDSYNDKIILIFADKKDANKYYFYSLDVNGNIKLSKEGMIESDYKEKEIDFDNNICIVNYYSISTLSPITGEVTNIIQLNMNLNLDNIQNEIKYKNGFLFYGSKNGYMAIEYYDLKNNTTQFKQLDEKEGTIYSIKTDNKDNLYIVGKHIDDNTTGKAFFSKYTYNNSELKKVYEQIYEPDSLKNDVYYFNDIVVYKNNKFALIGSTLNGNRYYTGKNFVVYYDGTKNYKIDKVIKGSGNLDIVESEEEDNEVKYQVKPGFGYKLISLKIVTESGKEIKVSDDYSFIMPDENITITAVFEPIINNPVTGNNIIRIILETAILITFIYGKAKSIKKNHN